MSGVHAVTPAHELINVIVPCLLHRLQDLSAHSGFGGSPLATPLANLLREMAPHLYDQGVIYELSDPANTLVVAPLRAQADNLCTLAPMTPSFGGVNPAWPDAGIIKWIQGVLILLESLEFLLDDLPQQRNEIHVLRGMLNMLLHHS